ncbi:hypothetical protein F5Y00DRAFT_265059 [Daldinia vernicosa]|uniref:uncharacterized protein n=1 Tax=Daldinia vernicosa TaxID=114800 RepID=UPI0020076088|nr:uncharacterized protein F5Y00DRAFT_265059 [Daldinia vernicosa]KAI0846015.1 hypothetical protein F5Y00DRAFT_265059 [Daldinia vernicosa]
MTKARKTPALRATKKMTGRTRRLAPRVLPQYQNHRKVGKVGKWVSRCLAALACLASIFLGAMIAKGCGTAALDSIYPTELQMNRTFDINL